MAVKNFSNYNNDEKSYVKLIPSKARGNGQVKVIFDSYPKVGLNKLPRTHCAWLEHTRRAHVQAKVLSRDVVLDPIIAKSLEPG